MTPEEKREHHKKYMKEVWYPQNRAKHIKFVNNNKLRKLKKLRDLKTKCSRCPETHVSCLEFHHIVPSNKIGNISELPAKGWSWSRIEEEIQKCVLLCSNCHRKLHWSEENKVDQL